MSVSAAAVRVRARAIKLAAFDVDGVLTDGGLLLGPGGQEFKRFHVRDGQGLVCLRDQGIRLAIITGRRSEVVAERMAELGIDDVFQGQGDKLAALEALLTKYRLEPAAVAYMGDDLPDLPVLERVGLAATVADAHPAIRDAVHWVAARDGGSGAVREFCDLILAARGWPAPGIA